MARAQYKNQAGPKVKKPTSKSGSTKFTSGSYKVPFTALRRVVAGR